MEHWTKMGTTDKFVFFLFFSYISKTYFQKVKTKKQTWPIAVNMITLIPNQGSKSFQHTEKVVAFSYINKKYNCKGL